MSRSVDLTHPAPLGTLLETNNLSKSDLYKYKSLSSTLPSTSTIPQDCPISSEPDPSQTPAFPVEVFEHIIDQSDDLDGSLCRLSLTCHTFLPRARLGLFFRVHIGHKEKLESAHVFLEARPWLPPLVHALTIRDYIYRYRFALHEVAPSRLIAVLPRLHILEFARDERDPGTYHIRRMRDELGYSPSMLSILRKLYKPIQHLELTGVKFKSIADFLCLLCALPHLKSLTSHRGSNAIEFESDGHTRLIKDKTLHLTQVATHQAFHRTAMKLLLDMSQATLENLTMHAQQLSNGYQRTEDNTATSDNSDMQEPTRPTFSQLRDLRILTLVVETFGDLDIVTDILNNIPTTGALQHLNIVISQNIFTPLVFNSINASNYRPLKTLEQAIIHFESLHQVVFIPPCLRKNRRGLWDPTLGRVFSLLKDNGTLSEYTGAHFSQSLSWSSRPTSTSMQGHDNRVTSLIVSPDGNSFASSSVDSTIILWDLHHGTIIHDWVGHSGGSIHSLAFSPDSQYLLSGGTDSKTASTTKVWDVSDGTAKEVQVLDLAMGGMDVFGRTWSANGMWSATGSGHGKAQTVQLHVWDALARSFRLHRIFEEPVRGLTHLIRFSPDNRRLVWPSSGGGERYFCVWDALAPNAPPSRIPLHPDDHNGDPECLSFDPSSMRLVTAQCGRLRVWDIVTGTPLAVMEGHTRGIYSAVFSPDGQYVLSASGDRTARVWLTTSGECTQSLEGHEGWVMRALFSPDGKYIATASYDRTVRLWRMGDASCLATFADHEYGVDHIVFSPDGKTLASGDVAGIVHIRDVSHITGQ